MRRLAFVIVLAVLSACAADRAGTPPSSASGLAGKVVAGPTCPVETEASPCPPKPVQTTVVIESGDGERLMTVRTNSGGRFRVALEPGGYLVSARAPSTDPTLVPRLSRVEVEPDSYAEVTVFLDTRLREPLTG